MEDYVQRAISISGMAKVKIDQLKVEQNTRSLLRDSRDTLINITKRYRELIYFNNKLIVHINSHMSDDIGEDDDFNEVVTLIQMLTTLIASDYNQKKSRHHPYSAAYVETMEIDEYNNEYINNWRS